MRTFNEFVEVRRYREVPVFFRAYFEKPVKDYEPYYELAQRLIHQFKGFPISVPDADNKSIDFQIMVPHNWLTERNMQEWLNGMREDIKISFNKLISTLSYPDKIDTVDIETNVMPEDLPEEPDYSQDEPRYPEF